MPLPRQPRSLATSPPSSEQRHWEAASRFSKPRCFSPSARSYRYSAHVLLGNSPPASPRCFLSSPVPALAPGAAGRVLSKDLVLRHGRSWWRLRCGPPRRTPLTETVLLQLYFPASKHPSLLQGKASPHQKSMQFFLESKTNSEL